LNIFFGALRGKFNMNWVTDTHTKKLAGSAKALVGPSIDGDFKKARTIE
jgi:hypothetical protein